MRKEGDSEKRGVAAHVGLLATAHRFMRGVMAPEAGLYHGAPPLVSPALRVFVTDVERTLAALSQALRDRSVGLDDLPDPRADQLALARQPADQPRDGQSATDQDDPCARRATYQ
jgi:hypothetical protein